MSEWEIAKVAQRHTVPKRIIAGDSTVAEQPRKKEGRPERTGAFSKRNFALVIESPIAIIQGSVMAL